MFPWSLFEQLAGEQEPTQVGWGLRELGITPLFAQTPQAKGKGERLFGVLQDRLMAEMGLWGIKDIKSANRFLHDLFIMASSNKGDIIPLQLRGHINLA